MTDETYYCHRCRDTLRFGDEYYDLDGLILCPDCAEELFASCLRYVGDTTDKTN